MTQLTKLRVFNEARQNVRAISLLCEQVHSFADLKNQVKRAAVSVVSNIAEGTAGQTQTQYIRYLLIARASNNEMLAQTMMISDLNPNTNLEQLQSNIEYVGKMLTKMIQYHRGR